MSLDCSKPFTRRAALASGISVSALTGTNYQRLFHGLYVGAGVRLSVEHQARAALTVAPPGSYVSHHTAARLWGGWAPLDPNTHVSVPPGGSRSERRGIAAHRGREGAPARRRGIPLSRPAEVFLELAAAGTNLVDLVAVGDSLVKAEVITPEELRDQAGTHQGAGCRRARRAAAYVRAGVDSVMESRLRMLIVLAGLPEPMVNKITRDEIGTWVWRFDLCYEALRLIIEYDGRDHQLRSRQWNSDIRRREQLTSEGWRIIVITAEAFFQSPTETLGRIWAALMDCGAQLKRRRPSPEWHRCFPANASASSARQEHAMPNTAVVG